MFGYARVSSTRLFLFLCNELLIARVGDPFTPPRGRAREYTFILRGEEAVEAAGGRVGARIHGSLRDSDEL